MNRLAQIEGLDHLDLTGQFNEDAAQAAFDARRPGLRLAIECLGEGRQPRRAMLERLDPSIVKVALTGTEAPPADEWWLRDAPPGSRLHVEWVAPDIAVYRTELPDTRPHGRCTIAGDPRVDQAFWFGRLDGIQVRWQTKRVVQYFEQGQQLRQEVYGTDGALELERHFDGSTIRVVRDSPAPAPMPSGPYGHAFAGRSTDALEVTASRTVRAGAELSETVSAALVARFASEVDADSVQGVLAASDDGAWTLYSCTVRRSGEAIEVVSAFFGDTRVGLLLADGAVVATLDAAILEGRDDGAVVATLEDGGIEPA